MQYGLRKILALLKLSACSWLAVALFVSGCSQAARKTSQRIERKDAPYDFQKEGRIPPLKEEDVEKAADVEEIPIAKDTIEVEEVEPAVDSSLVVREIKREKTPRIQGFRIQIFASLSSISAEEVKKEFQARFSKPAYVTYIDGMYKVRVGDFANRLEAESFLGELKDAGFKDAWIVESYVTPAAGGKR